MLPLQRQQHSKSHHILKVAQVMQCGRRAGTDQSIHMKQTQRTAKDTPQAGNTRLSHDGKSGFLCQSA